MPSVRPAFRLIAVFACALVLSTLSAGAQGAPQCGQYPRMVPNYDYPPNASQFDSICLPEAWEFMRARWQGISLGAPWPTVVVIDDGFFTTKDSSLRPSLFPGPGGSTAAGDTAPLPAYGIHGTSVLSLLASRLGNGYIEGGVGPIAGFANLGADFFLIRDRTTAQGPTPGLIAQFLGQYVMPYAGRRVVNISQSLVDVTSSTQLADQLDYANWEQIVVVTGAGNHRETVPANAWIRGFENVIVVGGLNEIGSKLWVGGTGVGSATGAGVDLYAPAENLDVLIRDAQIVTDSGTSFAAPLVTSVVAMMQNLDPTLDSWEVRDILIKTADAGTYRRLNAIKALLCVDSISRWSAYPPPGSNWLPVHNWSCSMSGFGVASGQRVGW